MPSKKKMAFRILLPDYRHHLNPRPVWWCWHIFLPSPGAQGFRGNVPRAAFARLEFSLEIGCFYQSSRLDHTVGRDSESEWENLQWVQKLVGGLVEPVLLRDGHH
jgi:hypothetical protein